MLKPLLTEEQAAAQFENAIAILRDLDAPFTAEMVYGLSDLAGERLQTFRDVWDTLPVERRRKLIARLVETGETNFDLDFSPIINAAIKDADPDVRKSAMEGVIEDSPHRVVEDLMVAVQDDPLSEVRAAAAKALVPFVLKGELGKLPAALNLRLQDTLWALYNNLNEDLDVRRRALEGLGNCGRDGVIELIREAYYADDLPMRISALFAMGRSCDDVWTPIIIDELGSEYAEMRYEATRAAGELELRPALPKLVDLAYEGDREIQEMAIWAIGEIGGKEARGVLENLASLADETGDDELTNVIAEAQGAATLVGDDILPLFDFGDLDGELDDDHMHILSLDDLDEDDDDEDDDDEDDDDDFNENDLSDLDEDEILELLLDEDDDDDDDFDDYDDD